MTVSDPETLKDMSNVLVGVGRIVLLTLSVSVGTAVREGVGRYVGVAIRVRDQLNDFTETDRVLVLMPVLVKVGGGVIVLL